MDIETAKSIVLSRYSIFRGAEGKKKKTGSPMGSSPPPFKKNLWFPRERIKYFHVPKKVGGLTEKKFGEEFWKKNWPVCGLGGKVLISFGSPRQKRNRQKINLNKPNFGKKSINKIICFRLSKKTRGANVKWWGENGANDGFFFCRSLCEPQV